MLVSVIPQTYTSVLFVSNTRFYIVPTVIGLFSNKLGFVGLKKSNTCWLTSALIETEAGIYEIFMNNISMEMLKLLQYHKELKKVRCHLQKV